jgi:hypothetical protein
VRDALLAHPAVDPLTQEVGVAVVPRVFLDHVHQDFAETVPLLPGDVEVRRLRDEPLREVDFGPPRLPRVGDDGGVGNRTVEVAVGIGVRAIVTGRSCPAILIRNQFCSTPAMCRTNPSRDRLDGSTARRARSAASRPEHFIRSVRR